MQKNTAFTPFDKLRTGFDKLRANGIGIESIGNFLFVLSLSKHEKGFFNSLLAKGSTPLVADC
jgi:hypothetical protein